MEQHKPPTHKTIIIMSVIVVIMTLLGYVCGVLSHNVGLYRQAQQECYEWLETECPCIYPERIEPEIPQFNITGGQNVQTNQSV